MRGSNLKAEEKFLENSEGEKIASIIHTPEEDFKGTVLLQHGLFSDKGGSWERRANTFAENGYKAIRFDRRGYGESDREFHEFNLTTGIEDTITILNHLEDQGEKKFAIYGSSFGGLIGIHAAVQDSRVSVMGLRAPATFTDSLFSEMEEVVREEGRVSLEEEMEGASVDESFFDHLEKYDASNAAEKLDIPTIIFHGDGDDVIPRQDSKKFYRLLDTEKEFYTVEEEGHVFSLEQDQRVLEIVVEWFDEYL